MRGNRKIVVQAGLLKGTLMYSPKIDEELIPRLYRLRKLKKIPMTRLVNGILENALRELEKDEPEMANTFANPSDDQSAR
jgi:hypothetical protein